MIGLAVLGGLSLRGHDGQEILSVLAQPKRLALLSYLAVATPRGGHRRDRLVTLFWPERDERRARHALNQALYALRQSLGEGVLVSRGDEDVSLDWGQFSCDADELRKASSAGDYARALKSYHGPLLEDFHIPEAPEFERWMDEERADLQRLAFAAATTLTQEHDRAGDLVAASEYARTAVRIAPYDEGAGQRLIRLLAQTGDRSGAIAEFEAFRSRLLEDLELEPAPETVALADEVRNGSGWNGGLRQEGAQAPRGTAESFEPPVADAPASAEPLDRDPVAHRAGHAPAHIAAPADGPGTAAAIATTWTPADHRAASGTGGLRRSALFLSASMLGIALLATAAYRLAPARAGNSSLESLTAQTVAVFPLSNLAASEQAYFAEGVAREVADRLSAASSLWILPVRGDTDLDAQREASRALGAGHYLRGTFDRKEERFRLVLEMLDVENGQVVWARSYDEPIEQLFRAEGDAAVEIAQALDVTVGLDEEFRMRRNPTSEMTAWDLFEQAFTTGRGGRIASGSDPASVSPETRQRAIELARGAVELDPGFGLGWSLLALMYSGEAVRTKARAELPDSVLAMARRGVTLDPEAHRTNYWLYHVMGRAGRPAESFRALLRAVELNPRDRASLGAVGNVYYHHGRFDQWRLWKETYHRHPSIALNERGWWAWQVGDYKSALDQLQRSLELRPPLSSRYLLTEVLLYLDRVDEARRELESVVELAPWEAGNALTLGGQLEIFAGELGEAKRLLEAALEAEPPAGPPALTLLAYVEQKLGNEDRAAQLLDRSEALDVELVALRRDRFRPAYDLARIHALKGDRGDALRWLERAVDLGWALVYTNAGPRDPLLASLRSDPRFERMMDEVRARVDAGRDRVEAATLPPTDEDLGRLLGEAWSFAQELEAMEARWATWGSDQE